MLLINLRGHLNRRSTETVPVAEKQDAFAFALSVLAGLNPLTPAGTTPHCLEKTQGAVLGVGTVVASHNLLDSLRGFVGVVEGYGGDVVVENVRLNNTVKELTTNETELAINGGGSAANVSPRFGSVVG